ncbi:PIN domain nuclease [Streptomyces sp. KLOTTS4A1]|uniref:PIN domain nuclease n=1 Tax=Streptomyces sp. KLOTTS4A1 TaxID=3390996 RepID=UPI0039F44935
MAVVAPAEQFLIDKSAAARILRPGMRDEWADVLRAGRVSMCEPTEFEMLYSARSVADHERLRSSLRALYTWCAVPDDGWRQALELQEQMVKQGCHRAAGGVDVFVSLTAKLHGLTVLHYDRDFETIKRVTGLKTRWLAEPGSLD